MKKISLSKYKTCLWAIPFLVLFFVIAVELTKDDVLGLDVFCTFVQQFINPSLTIFFKMITHMASSIALVAICFLMFAIFKNKKYSILIIINLVNVIVLNVILKEIFSRPRPSELILIEETGYSFPSGHSMAAMAFYGFLIYLIKKTDWSNKTKMLLSTGFCILILLIGLSRIYLGVHYLSDVLAGFSISIAYLIIFTTIISTKDFQRSVKDE